MVKEFQELPIKIYSIKKYTFKKRFKKISNDCEKICETITYF